MKSLKKTLVLLVVLSMILSAVSPVFAFSDPISEDYAEQANKMAAFGVFQGDAEGKFNAENNITRAEMAKVICKLMGVNDAAAKASEAYSTDFIDVPAGQWYTGWVSLAAGNGIINGFPDGTFRPNDPVTNDQVLTMIVRTLGYGELVDKNGTWPANYVRKALELKLFEDVPETDSVLATRGTVAIYCYNALTAKTWGIEEIQEGLATSKKSDDTLLSKYFPEFTNEAGKMKLVEDVKVEATGATTTNYGANQIVLTNTKNNIASFIDAESAPRKGKEEVTYDASYETGTAPNKYVVEQVVAYVPAEVADIANLAGKKVDVIFGENNEVAYLAVVSDVVDNSFVTAWNPETGAAVVDSTIEIDGEEYEFAANVAVSIFGKEVHNAETAVATVVSTISTLFGNTEGNLACLDAKGNLTRKVVADIELNPDDEIEAINFKFSANYTKVSNLTVAEYVVEDVTDKKIVTATTDLTIKTLENAKPRVVRNNKVATLDDIAAGDVLTEVTVDGNKVIYAVSNTVAGELTDYVRKSNALTIEGEAYNFATAPVYNVDGETDDFDTLVKNDVLTFFEDEEVTAYLNMFGEVVAIVGESEATGTVFGVITHQGERLKDRASKVYYVDVEILAEDGTQEFYSIYNKTTGKDMPSDVSAYAPGTIVVFSADEDGIIKSDKIELITADGEYLVADSNLTANFVVAGDNATANIDNKRLTVGTEYKYTDSTVIINYNSEKEELIDWKAFTQKETGVGADNLVNNEFVMFTRGTKIAYIVANLGSYGVSEQQYGIITDFDYRYNEDEERVYTVTVLTEGVEETYDCEDSSMRETYTVGDFIGYKVSDVISNVSSPATIKYDVVEALADLVDEDKFTSEILAMFTTDDEPSTSNYLDYIKVGKDITADSFEIEYTVDVAEVKCSVCQTTSTTAGECTNKANHASNKVAVPCTLCKATIATCPDAAEAKHTGASEETPCPTCGATKDCATHDGLVEEVKCATCESTSTAATCGKDHSTCVAKGVKDATMFIDLDEDVVVYDLTTGEMGEITEGAYVLVLDTDNDNVDYDIVVIVK